ncbi:hypothetical protein [Anaerocolumna aminovalerica]|uniref:hypothetical protein n=1 Tax=Anaerocolumna aminovalerica TaxID=1527 RepID=UPI000BE36987|nr:hypothetical protein [Anaerocolumna aminovalerica]
MEQNYSLFKGYRLIFWGIFFTSFNFNFFGIPILPQFIEWFIVYSGIKMLKEVYTSKSLISAVNCGTWIVLFTLVVGFISLFEPNIFKNGTLFTLIWSTGITTMQLILKYYILVGSIELLEVFHKQDVAEKYVKSTGNYIISYILVTVAQIIVLTIPSEVWNAALGIASLILNIWLMILISELKNIFNKEVV